MRQAARRASLVVVMLLASVGTASAECAWVLWQKIGSGPDTAWVTMAAYAAREECAARATKLTRALDEPAQRLALANAVVCLPDTIDPRGPKGK